MNRLARITALLTTLAFSSLASASWQPLANIDGSAPLNQQVHSNAAAMMAEDHTSYCMIIGIIDQLSIIESPEIQHPMYSMEQAFEISARRLAKSYPVICHSVFTGVAEDYVFSYETDNL